MDPFSAIIGTGLGIIGSIFGSGGPSPEQKALTTQETNLMTNLGSMTNERFAQQSQTLNQIQAMISNPAFFEQPGMSAAEYSTRQAQIISSVSHATTAATQNALAEMAGRGGGASSSLLSGPEAEVLGSVAAQGQIAQAGLENQLTAQSYDIGRQLGLERLKGAEALGQLEDPARLADAAASVANAANNQANTTAEATNAKNRSMWGGITGSIGAGMDALSQTFTGSSKRTLPTGATAMPRPNVSNPIWGTGFDASQVPVPDVSGSETDWAGGVNALGAGAQ
jgi:hypothetical protein